WRGDTSQHSNDSSAADLALCNLLAFFCWDDPGRIDRLFRDSGLIRDKWDEKRRNSTYGADTIAVALSGRTEWDDPDLKRKTPKITQNGKRISPPDGTETPAPTDPPSDAAGGDQPPPNSGTPTVGAKRPKRPEIQHNARQLRDVVDDAAAALARWN